ncbi:MAG: DUF1565 domain-containing protein [Fimbriimonadaceae bacterium]|nr:DUF1565 domain-containing protein [Fimbriimonadaceae bacterium]
MTGSRGWLSAGIVLWLSSHPVPARSWWVGPAGQDNAAGTAGAPLATFRRAVEVARPGDWIELQPGHYRQQFVLFDRCGEPGQPIGIDGHGAVIDGCDPLPAAAVQPAGAGRWTVAVATMPEAVVVDGAFWRQGRLPTHRGKPESLPAPADLQPGQWTWRAGQVTVCTTAPTPPRVEICVRDAAVRLGGRSDHWIFRNLIAQRHWNDGFNLHGDGRDLVCERVVGRENMDEGISSHETIEITVRDAEFWGNDNGVADVTRCRSSYHNTWCHDNVEFGFQFDGGLHQLDDCRAAANGTPLALRPGESLAGDPAESDPLARPTLVASHCLFEATAQRPGRLEIYGTAVLRHVTGRHVTPVLRQATMRLDRCLLTGAGRRLEVGADSRLSLLACWLEPGAWVWGGQMLPDPSAAPAGVWDGSTQFGPVELDAAGRPAAAALVWQVPQPAYRGCWPPRRQRGPGNFSAASLVGP